MKKLLLFFISFYTITSYAQFPENFENVAIANNTTPPATGWTTFTNGILPTTVANNNWQKSNLQFRGAFSARVRQLTVANGNTSLQWLVSPPVAKPVNGQVRFYTRKGQTDDQGGTYTLRYSTVSSTNPADYIIIGTWNESQISSTAWEQKFVLIPATVPTGQNIYIAFVKQDAAGDNWFVDDIKVDSQCLTPTALTAAPLETSASLSWTSPNPAGPWQIEYGPAGFTPGATPAQGTIINVTTNPYNLTGLTPMTGYTYYVRTMCDTDNPSPWSIGSNFTTTALPPVCGGNFIDEGGPTANYPNNENRTWTITPTNPGEIVTVTFSSFDTEANFDALYVFDGPSIASPLISSGNPAGTVPGGLAGGYWGTAIPGPFTSSHPSGALTFVFRSDTFTNRSGWVANVTCSTCPPPLRVNLVTATSNSLQVSWTNLAPLSTSYEVIYLPTGSAPPTAATTGQVTTSNPYTIPGLNSNTTYDVYVRPICSGTSTTGVWSIKGTFTTSPNYCAGDILFDSGGATGNYSNNENRTFTICPPNPGDVVTVFFNSFNISDDSLKIYDGNSIAAPLLGNFTGFVILPSLAASNTNTSGCLTFVFTSNANGTAQGWDANVVCGPACPTITAILDTANSTPLVNGKMNVCKNQNVQFAGTATAISGGTNISIAGATYKWTFDDGVVLNGQNVTRQFTTSGVIEVNLLVTFPGGCRSINKIRQIINVSTDPVFNSTISNPNICTDQTSVLSVAYSMVSASQVCVPNVTGITRFLPDRVGGQPPVESISEITIQECYTGRTITAASDIESICMNIEHSFLSDITMELIAPNGVSVFLTNRTGGSANLGIPWAVGTADGQSNILTPGVGYDYCFNSTGATTMAGSAPPNIPFPNGNGPGTYNDNSIRQSVLPSSNIYLPEGNFAAFIGSPIEGTWKLRIIDYVGLDNGYLFAWNMKFSSSIPTTSNQFTPSFVSGSWSPSPDIITPLNNPQITVKPTTSGTKCYTYNLTNNFGCTYSHQVCIDVTTGVSMTSNVANPLSVFVGQNGTYYFSGGTPNAVVTYNVNGGANQQIILDGSGNATVTVPSLAINTTVTATHIAVQPIPTSGFVVTTTGGVNPANSQGGPLTAAGQIANTSNCTTINQANPFAALRFASALPAGTVVTISIARSNLAGNVQITDGANTITFNSGNLNELQRIQFTMGRSTDVITITHNSNTGIVFLDGATYTYDLLGCDAPLNLSATVTVTTPPTPFITSITQPSNICFGSNAVFTILGSPNTTVTYTLNGGSNQTVNLDNSGQGTITVISPATDVVLITSSLQMGSQTATSALTKTIIINPLGQVNPIGPQTICQGAPTTAVTFSTSNITGNTTYTWSNNNTAIGLAAASVGNSTGIPSFVPTNTTTAPINGTITVTPTYTSGGVSCIGTPTTFTITVNPTPQITNQIVATCSDVALNFDLDALVAGSGDVYTYTVASSNAASVPTAGPRTVASSANITDTYTNATTAPVTITYTITPTGSNGCIGNTFTVTATINPEPLVTNQIVATCSDVALNFDLDALIAGLGDTFTYTVTSSNAASVPAAGPRTVGSSANITDVYNNTTTAPVMITYSVSPTSSNGCIGNTFTIIATINPEPIVTNQVVATCSDVALNFDLASLILGTGDLYTYTVASSNAASVPAAGPRTVALATNITDVYTNTTTAPVTITYTVTPVGLNGCIGNTFTVTATINPEPLVTNQIVATCSDVALNFDLDALVAGSGDVYTYTVASSNAASVPAAGPRTVASSANITNLYTNNTTAPVTITYTITPTGSNGCIGNTFTVTATINPEPLVTNQTVATCSDVALNFDLDALIAGLGDTFIYTVTSSNAASVPAAGPRTVGSSANITDVYNNTTTAPVTITYSVSPTSSNGCIGNTFTVIATINPEPIVTNQVVATCSDVALNFDLASLILGTGDLYTYTVASSNAASVPAAGPRTVASATNITDLYTNTTTAPVTITYTVTPSGSNGCIGNTFTVTVTVNPEPVVTNQTVTTCSDVALNYDLASLIAGTGDLYTYTVASSNAINVPAGNPRTVASAVNITDTYTNATTAPVTITYTITPMGSNGCIGNTFTLIVTVNPIANSVATPVSNFICTGTTTSITLSTPTTGTIPVTFQWTASVLTPPSGGSITGFSSDSTGTLNIISQTLQNTGTSIGVVRYVITPFIGLCPGTPVNVDITVNPIGQVNVISSQVFCPGNPSTAVVFSSSNTGITTYTWTNDNLAIGLAASSGGAVTGIPSFIATNTTAAPITGIISVVPTYTNGGVSCVGATETFTITVNPTPIIILSSASTTTNQTICVNSPIIPIQYTFGAGVTGVTVSGLPSGINFTTNGNIVTISGTPPNTAGIFNYTITAIGNSCGAPNLSGTIEVTNGISPIFTQVAPVCQGATINIPTSSTNTPPIVGVWNLISSTANDATYGFTPNPGQCALTTTMTIVVHPLPTVTPSVTTQSFCSGGTTNINLTSNVAGATFSWTATATTITGQSGSVTGSGATSINQILVLNANQVAAGQVTYVIVAEANGCLGAPVTVVVTVNPIPNVIVSPASLAQTICSGKATNISFSGAINNTVYSWSVVSSVGVSGALNGSGTTINQILTTTGLSQGTVVYEVTPSINGCTGTPQRITVTVNPVPEIFGSATHPDLCSGESTFISVSTFNATTVYNWVVVPVGVSGASAGTNSGLSINIAQPLTTTSNTQGYVDYIITPVLTGCPGLPITVRVYVNPLPVVSLTDGTICVDAAGVPFQNYVLDSGLNDVDYNFVWTFEGNTIPGATNATYTATQVGTYSVVATNSTTNCVSTAAFAVVTPTIPATGLTITQSEFFSDYATITVNVSGGTGTLLYQLDDGVLQESNVFTEVSGGQHIVTVVDTQGCTYLTKEVLVIDYPKYFTPNGDGIHDTWNIIGLNQPDAKLYIFDRYGKLLKQITPIANSQGWDGTYIGAQLPSTDYWFTLDYSENGEQKQFKAHFSLKR